MPVTFADLVARVKGLELRTARNEEDITAIISTVSEIHVDVRWLRQEAQRVQWLQDAMEAVAGHLGVPLPPAPPTTDDTDE